MSKQSEKFLQLAAESKQQAGVHTNEMRELLLSIADAYMLLAHVQAVVDDKTAVYAEPKLE